MLSDAIQTKQERNPESLKAKQHFLLEEAKSALLNGDLRTAARLFRDVSTLSIDLGDREMATDYFTKAEKIMRLLKSTQEAILRA